MPITLKTTARPQWIGFNLVACFIGLIYIKYKDIKVKCQEKNIFFNPSGLFTSRGCRRLRCAELGGGPGYIRLADLK
jgi:hypothetical protein